MSDALRSLSDDEVRQIGIIIESLEQSTFDFLQLEFGDVKLTISKGHPPSIADAPQISAAPSVSPQQTASVAAPSPSVPPMPTTTVADKGSVPAGAHGDSTAVVAPLLGRFYSRPEPGAPPFVSVGSEVTEDTTVGLIEVMKTFNAVRAGTDGVIVEICVQDAQFVEYGDALFRVQPPKAA
ncbi:MAG: acetyl-CoA carboxylase biotin carboxyl carrier protein subunit [Bradyrhizobium sp.]